MSEARRNSGGRLTALIVFGAVMGLGPDGDLVRADRRGDQAVPRYAPCRGGARRPIALTPE